MNVLFLTMSSGLRNIYTSGIYTDMMRKFCKDGHDVYIVYPIERRMSKPTELKEDGNLHTLGVRTLNVTKTNVIEKGIGQVLLESQFERAIKKYLKSVHFDLILYSTPPITFTNVIKFVKKHSPNAITYLLLKDIFPQNAVDLGMISKRGLKGILYKYFRGEEKNMYGISDYIGCMSPANVDYLLEHNPEIPKNKVELAPNSYDEPTPQAAINSRDEIRLKYCLPIDVPIFIYGGNMGKPQGIPFFVECMKSVMDRQDCYFVIVGYGTEYHRLESFMQEYKPKAVSLFKRLPKDDYDALANSCDIGMIFLDYRFTIPNYPSRLLPYLMGKKPILAVTDKNCDTGLLAEKNGYGFYVPSNSVNAFVEAVDKILSSDIKKMGEIGYDFFLNNYTTEHTYAAIMKHIK